MCFSAQASFIASATLMIIGFAIANQIRLKQQWLLAAIPFLFSIQQFCEGFVWVTLNRGDALSIVHKSAVYGFIFFAFIVWPAYIPTMLYYLERDAKRKMIIMTRLIMGCVVACILGFGALYGGVIASIENHHIVYDIPFLFPMPLYVYGAALILYVASTATPMLYSTIPYMWVMGVAAVISCVIALFAYTLSFASVWCFFAALLSAIVYVVIREWNKQLSN